MRTVFKATATVALLVVATSSQAAVKYVAADGSKESALCVSAAIDKPIQFANHVEMSGFPYRHLARVLTCNGKQVAMFSLQAGNTATATRLARYSQKRGTVDIRQAIDDSNRQNTGSNADKDVVTVVYVKGE